MKTQNHFLDLIENFSPLESLLFIVCFLIFFLFSIVIINVIIRNEKDIQEIKKIINKK